MGTNRRIDLNADVGESFGRWRLGDDEALLPLLTSANVACGFHAGDARTILDTVRRAAELGVVVGAQVSYRDLAGFGRRAMDIDPDDLIADVLYQIAALDGLARTAGTRVAYVKPHGALYHRTMADDVQAGAVTDAIMTWKEPLALLTTADGALAKAGARAGLRVVSEGFADRRYGEGNRPVPRSEPNALITDPEDAADQALRLVETGHYESLCVHGDTPGVAAIATAVRQRLQAAGVDVAAFATDP